MTKKTNTDITKLYAPQFEQFGIHLAERGPVHTGKIANAVGSGSAWVMPLTPNCLVMEHFITPCNDMMLAEYTPEPYACVGEMNEATIECMPAAGIRAYALERVHSTDARANICSFIQSDCGVELSPLFSGKLYHSRSIIFLPGYFEELTRSYPGEYAGLFNAFGSSWNEGATRTIRKTLSQIDEHRATKTGAHLYMRSVVDAMVAELARVHAAGIEAKREAGERSSIRLANEAEALMDQALEKGTPMGVDELAKRLYVSRSKLCETFKTETGESVGAYMRRRRHERACELLDDKSLTVAQVSARLGYPHQAAFAQAFKHMAGMSPTAYRMQTLDQ